MTTEGRKEETRKEEMRTLVEGAEGRKGTGVNEGGMDIQEGEGRKEGRKEGVKGRSER